MIGAIDRLTFGSAGLHDEPGARPREALAHPRIGACIVVAETREKRSTLTSQPFRSSPLLWAILVSALVHSALVVTPLYQAGRGPRLADASDPSIEVALATPRESAASVAVIDLPTPLQRLAEFTLPPMAQPVPASANLSAPTRPANAANHDGMLIEAQPLQDRDRLGDELATKLVREYPLELDLPVRLKDKIVARYPPAALAAGREGSVAAWVVVDAEGRPEEIQVTDGTEEFAASVRDAIQAARFLPAQNNLQKIRFPIALEFQFKVGAPGGAEQANLRP